MKKTGSGGIAYNIVRIGEWDTDEKRERNQCN